METIVAAACQIMVTTAQDNPVLTISMPAPARHHNILHAIFPLTGSPLGPKHQGFITSTGRYVGREEAMQLAIAAGQVDPKNRKSGSSSRDLFSEDLW